MDYICPHKVLDEIRSGILDLTSDFASQFGSDTNNDASNQEPQHFKLKNSCHGAIIGMGVRHAKSFSEVDSLSKFSRFSESMPKCSEGLPNFGPLSHKD